LLKDVDYLKLINRKIDEIKMQYAIPIYNVENINEISDDNLQFTVDDQLFLDVLLMEIRGQSISYAAHKKKENSKLEQELLRNIENIESNLNEDNLESLQCLKEELKVIQDHKLEGFIIRARVKNIMEGEKPSKFFLQFRKKSLHFKNN
jgi:hypothetical protein